MKSIESSQKGPGILARIISHQVIFKDSRLYSTFPWCIKSRDGEYMVVFRQAAEMTVKAAREDQLTHHDRQSWVALVRSKDGTQWGKYQKLYESAFGVNDPALTQTAEGELLLRVTELGVQPTRERAKLSGRIISHRAEHGFVTCARSNVVVRLKRLDGEIILGEQFDVTVPDLTDSCSREPVTELPDGTLLLSIYRGAPHTTDCAWLIRSFDSGMNWGDPTLMFKDHQAGYSEQQGINFNETSVLSIGNGEMLAIARADSSFHTDGEYMPVGGVGQLFSARSYNWGLSWTRPKQTGIFGQPAHLLDIGGGRLLCTYGYRRKPYGVRAVVTFDRGENWDIENEFVLRYDSPMWDVGYPMTLAMDDGRLLTVYYSNDSGGTRYIGGTIWSME